MPVTHNEYDLTPEAEARRAASDKVLQRLFGVLRAIHQRLIRAHDSQKTTAADAVPRLMEYVEGVELEPLERELALRIREDAKRKRWGNFAPGPGQTWGNDNYGRPYVIIHRLRYDGCVYEEHEHGDRVGNKFYFSSSRGFFYRNPEGDFYANATREGGSIGVKMWPQEDGSMAFNEPPRYKYPKKQDPAYGATRQRYSGAIPQEVQDQCGVVEQPE